MEKHDILKKARRQGRDEREKEIELKSFKAGWFGIMIIIGILIGLRIHFAEPSADLALILNAQMTASFFYQFWKTRNYGTLFAAILCLGALGMNLAALLTQYALF